MADEAVIIAAAAVRPATPQLERNSSNRVTLTRAHTPAAVFPQMQAAAQEPTHPVEETLAAVARQIESYLRSVGRSLEFRVDGATGLTVVSVRDSETGELIRQIPGEETMRLARALGNQSNVLIDLTA